MFRNKPSCQRSAQVELYGNSFCNAGFLGQVVQPEISDHTAWERRGEGVIRNAHTKERSSQEFRVEILLLCRWSLFATRNTVHQNREATVSRSFDKRSLF
ncbi:hypothetical protein CDAR_6951 [Caerostris darwini]|uniref:Uncharacterized protein n=1 Tax=Caerostris darwini TaxID=1538125 RepID=A0AAV4PIT9_9ARAC|nr:hypothetical protein CDAR_6951 [Caerostris darwini]